MARQIGISEQTYYRWRKKYGGMDVIQAHRLNGKLRDELLSGEIFYTVTEARVLIEMWRRHYNQVRPHSSLGYRPPAPEAVEGPPVSIAS